MAIKAIETTYRGFRFRSRLEARWAYLFDVAGIDWQYEPEGYDLGDGDLYLPDFFLPLKADHWRRREFENPGYWIEIKGRQPTESEIQKMHKLTVGTKHHGYIYWGDPGKSAHVCCSLEGHILRPEGRIQLGLESSVIFSDCRSDLPSYDEVVGFIAKARSARFEHGTRHPVI
jgi:hypothetical protein